MFISIRLAAACAAALMFGACASSPYLDQSFSDISGDAQLKAVLFADRSHDYGDVDLTLFEGRLMLTGTMWTDEGKGKLLANARKADGVDEIIDEVLIADKTSMGQGLEDVKIDKTLRAKLIGDDAVASTNYKIAVSRSVVYLIGAARSQEELNRALAQAKSVTGVENVVSHVVLRTQTDQ